VAHQFGNAVPRFFWHALLEVAEVPNAPLVAGAVEPASTGALERILAGVADRRLPLSDPLIFAVDDAVQPIEIA
jgi:hypothetical protein